MSKVADIIAAYDALIDRALEATQPGCGHYASVDHDDHPRLSLDGDDAVLTWREYESDYYGGGYCIDETAKFPAELLELDEKEFAAVQAKTKAEISKREHRVRIANERIAREQAEAHERAVWAALRAKYGS